MKKNYLEASFKKEKMYSSGAMADSISVWAVRGSPSRWEAFRPVKKGYSPDFSLIGSLKDLLEELRRRSAQQKSIFAYVCHSTFPRSIFPKSGYIIELRLR